MRRPPRSRRTAFISASSEQETNDAAQQEGQNDSARHDTRVWQAQSQERVLWRDSQQDHPWRQTKGTTMTEPVQKPDVIERAYASLTIRSVENEQRIIEGIASTPTLGRDGFVVENRGAQFKLPLPLLWQHDKAQPIGHVTWAEPNDEGIPFRAQIARSSEPGKLAERLDEAWQSIKLGLVRGMSIGFKPLEIEPLDKKGGIRFKKWDWMELSAV